MKRSRQPMHRGRSRQRGASAVFVAISMVASIAALGMTLDLGRLYFTHRELQLLADMAVLDAARSAGGCMGQVDDAHSAAVGEAAASLQRNGGSLAYLTAGGVEIGREIVDGGVRVFTPDDGPEADSVRVVLRRPLPSKLIPVFSSGPGGVMMVSSAATLRPIVSLDVASNLAEINPQLLNQMLGQMLGGDPVNITAAGYQGLFGASVRLGDLAAELNAGSVEDFLDTQTNAPTLLNALADALGAGSDAALRTTLATLAASSETSRTVVPRDVLGVPTGATADDALVNVGALVTSVAEASSGNNLINISLPVNLPQIGSVRLDARLIEVARAAVGPPAVDRAGNPQTFANTAQAVLKAQFGTTILGSPVNVSVVTQFANASAALTDLRCAQRGRPQPVVTVEATSGLGVVGIGNFDISAATPLTLPLPPTPIVDFSKVGIPVQLTITVDKHFGDDETRTLRFEGPFPSAPQTIGGGSGEALASALDEVADGFTLDVNYLGNRSQMSDLEAQQVGKVRVLAEPFVRQGLRILAQQVLEPAAAALGATTGSARVRVESVVAQQPMIYTR